MEQGTGGPTTQGAFEPPPGGDVPQVGTIRPDRRTIGRALVKVGIGTGLAVGAAVGAALIANAASSTGRSPSASDLASGSTSTTQGSSNSQSPGSGSTTTTTPGREPKVGHGVFGGPFGFGPGGSVVHGQFTIQGPNGYETLEERTGTVSAVSNVAGTSSWSLTVNSSDGSSATFAVDPGSSVNGGEMGIGSVKQGDTVTVVALDSNGTATAKEVLDRTALQDNGSSWMPQPPSGSSSAPS